MSGISTLDFEKYAKNRSGGKTNLRFFHLNAGIVKSIQHRGVLANKGNLENVDQLSHNSMSTSRKFPKKRLQTKIGVNCPSRSRRPLANAAADICQKQRVMMI